MFVPSYAISITAGYIDMDSDKLWYTFDEPQYILCKKTVHFNPRGDINKQCLCLQREREEEERELEREKKFDMSIIQYDLF